MFIFILFRIVNYTPDLSMEKTRRALTDAFKVWSGATKLSFTEVKTARADIMIQFASRYHQDGYPFDGNGEGIIDDITLSRLSMIASSK